jgi:hypothetical protein
LLQKKQLNPSNSLDLTDPPAEDSPLADWGLWCAEIGNITGAFKVFPCIPEGKRPLHKGWQDEATCDPETIEAIWKKNPNANIGLAIHPGFVAVDCDLYKPGAEETLAAFEAEYGKLPSTLQNNTPSGGIHLFYSTGSKTFGNSMGSLPDFGDVRGCGGYVVGPGSVFENSRYTVENLDFPVALPEHIENMLREGKATLKDGRRDYGEPLEWDTVQAKALVERVLSGKKYAEEREKIEERGEREQKEVKGLLKDYEGPFDEGERDNLTYQLFAVAKNRGIHPNIVLEEVKGSGISNGLGTEKRKMESAYHDGHTQDGYCSDVLGYSMAELFNKQGAKDRDEKYTPRDPVVWKAANVDRLPRSFPGDINVKAENLEDENESHYGGLLTHFTHELAASGNRERRAKRFGEVEKIPSVPWIIPGWLSQDGVWIMYGKSESFKTYITINMLLCVATGTPWARSDGFKGCLVGTPRPVILFAGESHSGVVQRVHAAIKGNGFDRKLVEENLILVPVVYAINHADGLARMADEIEALKVRPAVIAVDTLNLALEGNEDSSDEIKRALRGLRALAMMFGAAGLAIDHVGHGNQTRPRGSSAKKANSDGMILCDRQGDGKTVSLRQYKNRDDDKTKYRAVFLGASVNIGTDTKTGELSSNLFFSAMDMSGLTIGTGNKPQQTARDALVLENVAEVTIKCLKSDPQKVWSQKELADVVATDDKIKLSSNSLRQKHLKKLREDSSNLLSHHYDGRAKKWRYNSEKQAN